MVEVFKTNVYNLKEARRLTKSLSKLSRAYMVNFDLEDCDKVLRVEAQNGIKINIDMIITIVKKADFEIELMH